VPRWGVVGAAWVITCRSILVCIVLFLMMDRPMPRPLATLRDRKLWQILRPLLAGSAIYKASPLVDRYWGSHAPAGGLTVLNLAQMGMGALAQVSERTVTTPVTPQLARLAHARQFVELRRMLLQTYTRALVLTALILLVLVAARPWWSLLVQQLGLGSEAGTQFWWLLVLLLGFEYVAACGSLPVAAFIALGDSRTPTRMSIGAFLIGVVLKSIAFLRYGLPGLAIATSCYYVGNLVALSLMLERRLDAQG
jgi:peptidoglycan biosynthesis protein MviN/MurJ (putative lipid II flippase)